MGFKLTASGKLLSPEMQKNLDNQIKKAIQEIGDDIKIDIKERTSQGIDVDGKPFVPYSAKYRDFKRERKGKAPGAGDGSNVTLILFGGMLRAIKSKAKKIANNWIIEIYFSNADASEKAERVQRLRHFFGLSEKDANAAREKMREAINLKEANK